MSTEVTSGTDAEDLIVKKIKSILGDHQRQFNVVRDNGRINLTCRDPAYLHYLVRPQRDKRKEIEAVCREAGLDVELPDPKQTRDQLEVNSRNAARRADTLARHGSRVLNSHIVLPEEYSSATWWAAPQEYDPTNRLLRRVTAHGKAIKDHLEGGSPQIPNLLGLLGPPGTGKTHLLSILFSQMKDVNEGNILLLSGERLRDLHGRALGGYFQGLKGSFQRIDKLSPPENGARSAFLIDDLQQVLDGPPKTIKLLQQQIIPAYTAAGHPVVAVGSYETVAQCNELKRWLESALGNGSFEYCLTFPLQPPQLLEIFKKKLEGVVAPDLDSAVLEKLVEELCDLRGSADSISALATGLRIFQRDDVRYPLTEEHIRVYKRLITPATADSEDTIDMDGAREIIADYLNFKSYSALSAHLKKSGRDDKTVRLRRLVAYTLRSMGEKTTQIADEVGWRHHSNVSTYYRTMQHRLRREYSGEGERQLNLPIDGLGRTTRPRQVRDLLDVLGTLEKQRLQTQSPRGRKPKHKE